MAKIPASNVKLITHRWAMHAVQALAQRDDELLCRVFRDIHGLPEHAVDKQVRSFDCGAPLQFHDYGFFDQSSSAYGTALFETVVQNDTLLHLALRRYDPASARALIQSHACLEVANALGERPIDVLFDIFAALQLHQRQQTDSNTPTVDRTPAGQPFPPILGLQTAYESLLSLIRKPLETHHERMRDTVKAELCRIYAQHAPDRLAKVAGQIADFEFREAELLRSVMRKYDD